MRGSTRILILLIIFELIVIGVGYFSVAQIRSGAWSGGSEPEEFIGAIRDTVELLVPVIGAVLIVIYLTLRAGEKRADKQRNP
ncbi:MAG: hypothetical protein DI616_13260 [Paracoccus denitrificans]|uniref:Uncharacterized protein n=1 Tax=Paracoccus denitrificans TaxID=266 RepID=A0A533I5L7_PARDE|nr:MAG: hypothetical protein DI616_13260 [Paracoccus denitrificans]